MYSIKWTQEARERYESLMAAARKRLSSRQRSGKTKSSKEEGLFKQVHKTITLLGENPRQRSLQTHAYLSIRNPFNRGEKVFEAYAQQKTPAAYRVFWCYGPERGEILIIAITSHP